MSAIGSGNRSLLAEFLHRNVCDDKRSPGFIYPLEIDWLLEAFGVQANFGWDEDGLFAVKLVVESLRRQSRRRQVLEEIVNQKLKEISLAVSTCEARLVLEFRQKLDGAIDAGKVEMEADGVASGHVADLTGGRRFYLRAVLVILARYRCEPFRRNLRPIEGPEVDGESNVVDFRPSDNVGQDDDADLTDGDEAWDDDDQPSPSSCQILEFPTPFRVRS